MRPLHALFLPPDIVSTPPALCVARWQPRLKQDTVLARLPVDVLYLDTTYCKPTHTFPSQQDAIASMVEVRHHCQQQEQQQQHGLVVCDCCTRLQQQCRGMVAFAARHPQPTPAHSACAGKHTGMLCCVCCCGVPHRSPYVAPRRPQRVLARALPAIQTTLAHPR
jgi:hypothetical protein